MIYLESHNEKKCGNCYWFNGEEGDNIQFCDQKEQDVYENGYCFRWRMKEIRDWR